jgi:NifU-like protein involved in Fe-S cluster formation
MSDPLYRKELLRLAADATGAGRLSRPDATGVAFNAACGDRVTVDLTLKDGCITAMAHQTCACVLAQASASILGSALIGARRPDIERLHETIMSMLKAQGGAPAPPYSAYGAFEGTIEHIGRHRCVLLPVEAVLAAFDPSEGEDRSSVTRHGE